VGARRGAREAARGRARELARDRRREDRRRGHGKTEEGTKQQARLRAENTALKQRDADRESAIERLSAENLELQAGERWPYLITGAGILGFGMIIGAVVQALIGGRRNRRRIKF
jgi:hypothetical protein